MTLHKSVVAALLIITATNLSRLPVAQAAHPRKSHPSVVEKAMTEKVRTPAEQYAATEEPPTAIAPITVYSQTESEAPSAAGQASTYGTFEDAPVIVPAPVVVQSVIYKKPSLQAPTHMTATAQTSNASGDTYDQVPPQQTESILRRLKLVEMILKSSGRAYDYRIHTTRELEGVLNHLQSSVQPKQTEPLAIPQDENS